MGQRGLVAPTTAGLAGSASTRWFASGPMQSGHVLPSKRPTHHVSSCNDPRGQSRENLVMAEGVMEAQHEGGARAAGLWRRGVGSGGLVSVARADEKRVADRLSPSRALEAGSDRETCAGFSRRADSLPAEFVLSLDTGEGLTPTPISASAAWIPPRQAHPAQSGSSQRMTTSKARKAHQCTAIPLCLAGPCSLVALMSMHRTRSERSGSGLARLLLRAGDGEGPIREARSARKALRDPEDRNGDARTSFVRRRGPKAVLSQGRPLGTRRLRIAALA